MSAATEEPSPSSGGRCGLDEDDPEDEAPAVTRSLLERSPRSMWSWEGAAARIRGIVGSQKLAPLDKVKRLRDFAAVLSEYYKPAPDESCCARFKQCLAYLWSFTGIQLSAKQNFPHEQGCLQWSRDIYVPIAWWCLDAHHVAGRLLRPVDRA